jgi:hypothetical protein
MYILDFNEIANSYVIILKFKYNQCGLCLSKLAYKPQLMLAQSLNLKIITNSVFFEFFLIYPRFQMKLNLVWFYYNIYLEFNQNTK